MESNSQNSLPTTSYEKNTGSSYKSNLKRKYDETDDNKSGEKRHYLESSDENKRYIEVVSNHYNVIERNIIERSKSEIFHLRSFNNWIKSMLINEYLNKIKESSSYSTKIKVLDLCCGKGGDLLKWRQGNISHLICCDVAEVSIQDCEQRYHTMKNRRDSQNLFDAEFFVADVSTTNIRRLYKDVTIQLDLISCQFALHYCFKSLPQVECMLQNVSECLKPGGYFFGTIPNAYELISRGRKLNSTTYGNNIYKVNFHFDLSNPPLFGASYDFYLEDAVNCPEFLVYFPLLEKMALKYGLKLVKKETFDEIYERLKYNGRNLLEKMNALEVYNPEMDDYERDPNNYSYAREFIKRHPESQPIATLSQYQWETATLYLTFAFQKQKRTGYTKDGKPIYDNK